MIASKKFCDGPGTIEIDLVALRANQMIKPATTTATKMEFESQSMKASPLSETKIYGAWRVSDAATNGENGI